MNVTVLYVKKNVRLDISYVACVFGRKAQEENLGS